MTKISKSPHRNTFQKGRYLERKAQEGRTPENDPDVRAMAEYYDGWDTENNKREADPEWRKNNLEYDLRASDWILEKVRNDEAYAQNLYASMCNTEFVKNDVWPLLKNQRWSCSWRHAGGIIADMRQQGDYIDWYCSGIRGDLSDEEYQTMTKEQQEKYFYTKTKFVGESVVTDEVRADLLKLGWIVIDDDSL